MLAVFYAAFLSITRAEEIRPSPPQNGGEAPASFRFVVVGDTQTNRYGIYPKVYNVILDEINALNPDFVVNVGDIVLGMASNGDMLLQQLRGFDKATQTLKAPLHVAFGNHEMGCTDALQVLKKKFGYLYTSFDHKGAHFVLLNTYLPLEEWGSIRGEQLRWLQEDLAANASKKPIFVFMHKPMFPFVPWLENIPRAEQDELHSLFRRYGVAAVFGGHQHLYHKEQKDGVAYYTTGGGGGMLLESPLSKRFYHFLLVTVNGGCASVDVHRIDYIDSSFYEISESLRYLYWDEPLRSPPPAVDRFRLSPPSKITTTSEERLFSEAYELQVKGEYEKAIEKYERALKSKKLFAKATNNRAVICYVKGAVLPARDMLVQLLADEPHMEPARFNLAVMQSGTGSTGDALKTIADGLALNPKSSLLHTGAGIIHAGARSYPDAEREFRQALELEPASPHAREELMRMYAQSGRIEQASRECRDLTVRYNSVWAWSLRGEVYLARGCYPEAIDCYTRARGLGALDAFSLSNLGNAYLKVGDTAQARFFYEKAIQEGQSSAEATFNLALAIIREWRVLGQEDSWNPLEVKPGEKAIAMLKSISSDETPAQLRARALNNLGVAYYISPYFNSDIIAYYFNQAIAADPRLAIAYVNLGSVYWENNQIGEAGLAFLRAIELDPGCAEAKCNLALLLFSERKVEQAIKIYREIIEKNPRFYEAFNGLGESYLFMHNTTPGDSRYLEMASEMWRRSIDIKPEQPFISYRLQDITGPGTKAGETPKNP